MKNRMTLTYPPSRLTITTRIHSHPAMPPFPLRSPMPTKERQTSKNSHCLLASAHPVPYEGLSRFTIAFIPSIPATLSYRRTTTGDNFRATAAGDSIRTGER